MSGSELLIWLEYRPEEVNLNLLELKHYSRKGASGNRVNFFFCGSCGRTICGTMEGRPSLFLIPGVLMKQIGSFPGLIFVKGPHKNVYKGLQGHWMCFENLICYSKMLYRDNHE
tara:strand:- start:207 stop:548 length:342 start_codon:yes stop_codon:yes gene_type:complete